MRHPQNGLNNAVQIGLLNWHRIGYCDQSNIDEHNQYALRVTSEIAGCSDIFLRRARLRAPLLSDALIHRVASQTTVRYQTQTSAQRVNNIFTSGNRSREESAMQDGMEFRRRP